MKFILSSQEFSYLIGKVQSIVAAKAAIPILSNFLIEAKDNQLILTATDLTVGIQCQTEAKVLKEGKTTLPIKTFSSLVKTLTSSNIEVSTNEQHITEIVAGSSRFKIHGMSPQDFPNLPEMQSSYRLSLNKDEVKNALYRTAFAVSKEDNRYILTGIMIQIKAKEIIFTGTDGKRLARFSLPLDFSPPFTGEYVVPVKAVEEILRNLQEDQETVTFSFMPDKIGIKIGSIHLITKLLSGEYPDVDRVIPKDIPHQIPVHREELITLLRQISLFTADSAQAVHFHFLNGELKLASNTMDVGEGKVSMVVNYKGPEIKAAFNPRSLKDILEHSQNERIVMGITDAHNPAVIQDEQEEEKKENDNPLFILMPMRVQ